MPPLFTHANVEDRDRIVPGLTPESLLLPCPMGCCQATPPFGLVFLCLLGLELKMAAASSLTGKMVALKGLIQDGSSNLSSGLSQDLADLTREVGLVVTREFLDNTFSPSLWQAGPLLLASAETDPRG